VQSTDYMEHTGNEAAAEEYVYASVVLAVGPRKCSILDSFDKYGISSPNALQKRAENQVKESGNVAAEEQ
jgi:hypothetical protein